MLVVKDNLTFLDVIANQVKHQRAVFAAPFKFILMNSFSTNEDSLRHLEKSHPDLAAEEGLVLMQNKV